MHSEGGRETLFGERAETGAAQGKRSRGAKATDEIMKIVEEGLPFTQFLALERFLRHAYHREQAL